MKIVIDIDREVYNFIKNRGHLPYAVDIANEIATGTVLPKGHGDLIDRTSLLDEVALTPVAERNFNSWVECVECLPVIIKADDEVG